MDKPAFKAAVDLYQDVTMEPVAATSKHTQQQHTSASTQQHTPASTQQQHTSASTQSVMVCVLRLFASSGRSVNPTGRSFLELRDDSRIA